MFCRHCGYELKDDHKFCPYCGQKVIRPTFGADKKTDATEEKQAPMPENTAETTPKEEYDFCKCCGQKVLANAEKCPFCGRTLVKTNILKSTPHYGYNNQTKTTNKTVQNGLLFSIIALVAAFIPFIGVLPSLALALAGTILGVKNKSPLAVVLGIVAVVAAIAFSVYITAIIGDAILPSTPGGRY